ncbi:MAG: hypothetical protein MZV64_26435 [Ignavibacteriales bacterium]|nr:hypothetical protein [Ignavibacteriales bacterium]
MQSIGISVDYAQPILPDSSISAINKIDSLLKDKIDANKKLIILSPATTRFNKHSHEENWSKLLDNLTNYNVAISAAQGMLS